MTPRRLVCGLLLLLLTPAPAAAGEGFPTDPQDWREVAEGLRAFDEYKRRRLVLAVRDGDLVGPRRLGFARRDFRQDNAARFYVVVEGDPGYRLTYPELIRLSGDPLVIARYERYVDRARQLERDGQRIFFVGVGFAVASVLASSISFDQGDFTWTPAVVPSLIGCTVTFMIAGGGLAGSGKRKQRELVEDYRFERILDRDEAWAAVQRHNSALRRELDLPDDERMDAPAEP